MPLDSTSRMVIISAKFSWRMEQFVRVILPPNSVIDFDRILVAQLGVYVAAVPKRVEVQHKTLCTSENNKEFSSCLSPIRNISF